MAAAPYERVMQLRDGLYFRHGDEAGLDRIVSAPVFFSGAPSAFEQLTRFEDAPLEIGRMGNHHIDFLCNGFDIVDDGPECLDVLKDWMLEGGICVGLMSSKQC